ncbi:MAG: hypothetical protein U0531_02520 [Dehalococcoidia bacterium]
MGFLGVIAAAAFVTLYGLALATSPTAAARTLAATLPVLTDLDQALVAHADAVMESARAGVESVAIPGLPLPVTVPREAALAGGDTLRRAAVDAALREVYGGGHAVFRAPDAPPARQPTPLSTEWVVQRTLDLLTRATHTRLSTLGGVSGVALLALLGLLVLQVEGRRRPMALGSVLVAGAIIAALGALLARGGVWLFTSGDDDVVSRVAARTARDLTFTVAAAAGVVGAAGVLGAAIGSAVLRLGAGSPAGRRGRTRAPAPAAREPWEEA